jgi:hypothetical protein
VAEFKTGILGHNPEETEKSSVAVQQVFFDVMNDYDYPVPPVLAFIQKDLSKAIEALGSGDLAELDHELFEVESFFPRARVALLKKGIPREKLDRCNNLLEQARTFLEGEDLKTLATRLGDLQGEVDAITASISPPPQ